MRHINRRRRPGEGRRARQAHRVGVAVHRAIREKLLPFARRHYPHLNGALDKVCSGYYSNFLNPKLGECAARFFDRFKAQNKMDYARPSCDAPPAFFTFCILACCSLVSVKASR